MRRISLLLVTLILAAPAAAQDYGVKADVPMEVPDRSLVKILLTRMDETYNGKSIIEIPGTRQPSLGLVTEGKVRFEMGSPPMIRYELTVTFDPPVDEKSLKKVEKTEQVWSTCSRRAMAGIPKMLSTADDVADEVAKLLSVSEREMANASVRKDRAQRLQREASILSRKIREFKRDGTALTATATLLEGVSLKLAAEVNRLSHSNISYYHKPQNIVDEEEKARAEQKAAGGSPFDPLKSDLRKVKEVARREVCLLLPKMLLPVVEKWKEVEADKKADAQAYFVKIAKDLKDMLQDVQSRDEESTTLATTLEVAGRMTEVLVDEPLGDLEETLKLLEKSLRSVR